MRTTWRIKIRSPGDQSTGSPLEPMLPSTSYSTPPTVANSVSSPTFNLPPHLPPISEKSPLSSPLSVSDEKAKVRTEAPLTVSYMADLPHPSAATMGTTARTSLDALLGISQLKLEGRTRYFGGWKPSVRACLVKVERWMCLMCYPPSRLG